MVLVALQLPDQLLFAPLGLNQSHRLTGVLLRTTTNLSIAGGGECEHTVCRSLASRCACISFKLVPPPDAVTTAPAPAPAPAPLRDGEASRARGTPLANRIGECTTQPSVRAQERPRVRLQVGLANPSLTSGDASSRRVAALIGRPAAPAPRAVNDFAPLALLARLRPVSARAERAIVKLSSEDTELRREPCRDPCLEPDRDRDRDRERETEPRLRVRVRERGRERLDSALPPPPEPAGGSATAAGSSAG